MQIADRLNIKSQFNIIFFSKIIIQNISEKITLNCDLTLNLSVFKLAGQPVTKKMAQSAPPMGGGPQSSQGAKPPSLNKMDLLFFSEKNSNFFAQHFQSDIQQKSLNF